MAVYNEIQIGRLNRFLQKYLGIKGGPPAAQLQGDIGATINLFSGVENRILESWFRYGCASVQTGVAAQPTNIRFRNPVGSNVLAVIEQINVTNGGPAGDAYAVNLNIGGIVADLGSIFTISPLDSRALFSQKAACHVTGGNNNSTSNAIVTFGLAATNNTYGAIYDTDHQLLALPGDTIQIDNTTVNQGVRFNFLWRERAIEDSERTA